VSDRRTSRDFFAVTVDPETAPAQLAVRLRGESDLDTAPLLQQRLADAIDGDARELVLDVSAVSFCDVTGLDVILDARSRLSSRGGRLSLLGPCRPLQIMLRALALEGELPMATPASPDPAPPIFVDQDEHGP
jgi:anti-sigma B factor antagonist